MIFEAITEIITKIKHNFCLIKQQINKQNKNF